jgi:uncharacterized protein YjbJ (UPF0337 family)
MYKALIGAIGHQLIGAAKSGAGKLLGDAKLMADGAAEQAAARTQGAAARANDPLMGMDRDRVDGIGHQLRGAVKEGFGKLVGDPIIEADGHAERASGKLQNIAGSARDERRDADHKTDDAA